MKPKRVHVVLIVVRFRREFECARCGIKSLGNVLTAQMERLSMPDLETVSRNIGNYDMPVGWSYGGKYTCLSCKGRS